VQVRALVAEDHVALANRIGEGLRDAGFAVDVVYDGAVALDARRVATTTWSCSAGTCRLRVSTVLSADTTEEATPSDPARLLRLHGCDAREDPSDTSDPGCKGAHDD
jgi:CheY-like chemotaxis protein